VRETLDTVNTCLRQGAEELDFCFELCSRGVRKEGRVFEARSLLVPEAVCYFPYNLMFPVNRRVL
jgi:hypothetical protein